MIVGPRGCGKSSLANALEEEERPYRRVQEPLYRSKTIDVPASYLENRWMYQNIIALAQNHGACLLLLINQADYKTMYSPAFAQAFTCPVFGVITHSNEKLENRSLCEQELAMAGVKAPYYLIDFETGQGLVELKGKLDAL